MDTNDPPRKTDGPVIAPALRSLINNLDLRYPRPASQSTDQRDGQLKLLAEDISSLPIEMIERAVKHWIMTSAYMPKAADIANLVKGFLAAEGSKVNNAPALAAARNAKIDAENPSFGARWIGDQHGLRLAPRDRLSSRPVEQCTPGQAAAIMREFKIPSSSIIGAIARTLGEPRRTPTAAETAELIAEQPRPDDAEMEWRRSMPDEPIPEQRGDERAEAVG